MHGTMKTKNQKPNSAQKKQMSVFWVNWVPHLKLKILSTRQNKFIGRRICTITTAMKIHRIYLNISRFTWRWMAVSLWEGRHNYTGCSRAETVCYCGPNSLRQMELQEGGEDYVCPGRATWFVIFTKYCCDEYRWRIGWVDQFSTNREMSNARKVLVALKVNDGM